jgi:hypothetical protein
MFDFMILAGYAALALKFYLWLASVMGFLFALVFLATVGVFIYPFVALYRWWASDSN